MPNGSRLGTVLVASVLIASCRADDPMPLRFKARLEALLGMAGKEPTDDEVQRALLRQLREPGSRSAPFPSRQTISDFYERRANQLVWLDADGKTGAAAATLLGSLHRAGDEGLEPDDYAVDRLEALERDLREKRTDAHAAERIADFDLLATTAFFRYASDLSTGRVHPDEVESDWHTKAPETDLPAALDEALTRGDLEKLIASLPPPHPGYGRLKDALAKLRAVEAAGAWRPIPPGPKIGRGARGQRVALLRQRLDATRGDQFDAALVGAVRRFQTLHGLEPDGVVSTATLDALNVPVSDRIRQVELNLERWRWIPRDLGDSHVLVNIPGFDLELDRKGSPPWRTRVVAGKAYTPTPVFSDRIVAIVVNPPWNVPESIAVNEYLPELQKDRKALAKEDVRLYQGAGDKARELNPEQVDWKNVDPEHFPYWFRQEPGATNPLGRVKFDLTNDFQIYLHDTPAGGAFSRAGRGLSHGCIRVQNALELANQISSEAVQEKLSDALEHADERRIELDKKIPVHILYWTAWVDDAGNLHFGPDLYQFDPPQRAALDKVTGKRDSGAPGHDTGAGPT
jgi:murein L,D-transpeptidase YcbB/YkuD